MLRIQYEWSPYKKRKIPYEDKETQGECYDDDTTRDWRDAAINQGMPIAETKKRQGQFQKLRRGKEAFYPVSEGVWL